MWTLFGWIAFASGDAVHARGGRTRPGWPRIRGSSAAATLALAGAFQFSDLKERCLSECRHPGAYLLPHYRRGTRAAFRIGREHGLFCLGCCWALMLLVFALGVTQLRLDGRLHRTYGIFEGARGRRPACGTGSGPRSWSWFME